MKILVTKQRKTASSFCFLIRTNSSVTNDRFFTFQKGGFHWGILKAKTAELCLWKLISVLPVLRCTPIKHSQAQSDGEYANFIQMNTKYAFENINVQPGRKVLVQNVTPRPMLKKNNKFKTTNGFYILKNTVV